MTEDASVEDESVTAESPAAAANIASLPALNLTSRPIPTWPAWPMNLTFSLGAAGFFMPVSPPTAPTVIVTDTTNRQ